MRKSIFDILSEELNLKDEIERIEVLTKKGIITVYYNYKNLEEFINQYCLSSWKSRNRCISYNDMREKLNISEAQMKSNPTYEQMLIYLEFVANMLSLCDKIIDSEGYGYEKKKEYNYLLENLLSLVADMNFELVVIEEKEQIMLVEKNPAATSVAEIVESDYARKVIEYNHFRMKGDIEGKREILNLLANKFESIRPSLKTIDSSFASDIGQLLNKMNIRHNNIEGKNMIPYVRDMPKEQLEAWYDEIYQMILLAILRVDNIERGRRVDVLLKELNDKTQ